MLLCKRKLFQHVTTNNVKHLHQMSLKMHQNIYGVAFEFLKTEGHHLVTQFQIFFFVKRGQQKVFMTPNLISVQLLNVKMPKPDKKIKEYFCARITSSKIIGHNV